MLTGFHWFLIREEESLKIVFLGEAEAFGLSKPCRTLSWRTKAVLEGSPCGSVGAAVEMAALSPAGWESHLHQHSTHPSAVPPGTSAGPMAPSQLGPNFVHPPALSEELLVISSAACAYGRQ